MGKLAQATIKYNIYAKIEADGLVEKPDVIGAIFGQTEGLLGPEMDLHELQRMGRIGRIDANLETRGNRTSGTIIIPSSLDTSETALIAACIETIERVGPCAAHIKIEKIEDVRNVKRAYILDRAKELLSKLYLESVPDVQELTEKIKEEIRVAEITEWHGLPAGPGVNDADNIIIVEGRADVINLLKAGIKNVIAVGGTAVPQDLSKLIQEKTVTVFLDGDRGGDLILREIMNVADIDFVARAPPGKEVEELSKKEIFKALRDRIPIDQIKIEKESKPKTEVIEIKPKAPQKEEKTQQQKKEDTNILESLFALISKEETQGEHEVPKQTGKHEPEEKKFKEILEGLVGTRAACFLNATGDVLGRVPVREMYDAINEIEASVLIFDGEIDQRLINIAARKGIKYLIGMRAKKVRVPQNMKVLTLENMK
jgi:DNA primase